MITHEMMTELAMGKRPAWIFTCEGRVQFYEAPYGVGPIVATSRKAADACADDLTKTKGKRVSVSEVGTVQGETLSGQIATAVVREGATGVFATDDGTTMYYFQAPPVPEDDE